MPFNNYSELIDEIVDLIGRSRWRTKVPGWIQLAENEAVISIRDLRQVRYKTTGNFVSGEPTLALPDGLTGIDAFQIDVNPIRLVMSTSIETLLRRRALQSATSNQFATVYAFTEEGLIELAPTPQTNDQYTLFHTQMMNKVDSNKYTSDILEQAPQYLMYRAAYHQAKFTRNIEQQQSFGPEAEKALILYGQFLARMDKGTIQVGRHINPRDYPQTTGFY